MRLRRLDLTRYGRFTDRVIDFGPRRDDAPDFHVIHGPNEAGKSTLFSAWLDFLYGMPLTSKYNFLHDYKTMRVGALIETAAGSRELARIKKQAGSLLDAHDQPVGDTMLAGDLGGLDREAYRTMFSLDETSLEQGGEAILASKGDLGQLLFSASAGLSDLASRLDRIREETDQFHRPRAHKSDLADLKRRLDELKAERDAIDIAASEHQRLVAERDRAREAHENANRRRADLRVRLERTSARLAALPHLARLGRLRDEFEAIEVVPQAPEGWRQEIAELSRRQVELQTALGRLERDIAGIETAIAAAPPRDRLLDRAAEFEALQELAGRALSEERDMPHRIAERDASERSIAANLARLGQDGHDNPRQLLLPAKVLGALRGLIATHSGVEARLESASREVETAAQALGDLQARWAKDVGDSAPDEPDPHLLADLAEQLSALRAVDLDQREAAARRDLDEAARQLERRMSQLRLWSGDPEALADIAAPAPTVLADLGRRLAEAVERVRQADLDLTRLKGECSTEEAERSVVASVPGIVGDSEARVAREAREAAWAAHRASLDGPSADRFRTALDADDHIVTERSTHVAEMARLRNLDQSIARTRARVAAVEQDREAAIAVEQSIRSELARLVADTGSGLTRDMEFIAFEAWCTRLTAAQETNDAALRARRALDTVSELAETRRKGLRNTLVGLGLALDDENLTRLVAIARGFLDGEGRRASLREALRQKEVDFERRQTDRSDAIAARQAWDADWRAALQDSWLTARDIPPSVAEMSEILERLQALEGELDRRDGILDRISKMERDIAVFATQLLALSADLGLDTNLPPHVLHRQFGERLMAARNAETRLRDARDRLAGLEDERKELLRDIEAITARINRMTAYFSVDTVEDLEARIALADKRVALRTDIDRLAEETGESLGLRDLTALDNVLADIDRDALAAEIEAMRPQADALDEETARAYADLNAAERKLAGLGSDGGAARLAEARRTVLLEIEDGARRYLELRLGALATDQALRLFRDRHQSSMMKKASEAFSQLTRGNYRNLTAQRDGQREVLIAVGADGSSKEATEMSTGTQFQLYLALRVAGYQEYAASRTPVPFIADDIMESFDEDRSEEALTQLSRMARSGQVIYLTHHRHICDIARAVCPSVTVHTL